MNKSVLITNIQKIKTNMEQTVDNLSSMLEREKIYSKEQVQKNIDLLQVKLQNDDNYKIVSNDKNYYSGLIQELDGEKVSLKKVIRGIEFRNNLLNKEIEKLQASFGLEQKELEILANNLNGSKDEEVYLKIKDKRNKIDELKSKISLNKDKIIDNTKKIDMHKQSINELDKEQESYCDEIDMADDYELLDDKKMEDLNYLNRFNAMIKVIDSIFEMNGIISYLDNLVEYLKTRDANSDNFLEKLILLKQMVASLNGDLLSYLAIINLDECCDEQGRINSRLNDENGYFLSDSERKIINDEIYYLNLDILLCQEQIVGDEQTISEYDNMIKKVNDDIKKENSKNAILEQEINDLTLRKIHFVFDKNDEIDKIIKKKKRKINNNKKYIEKLMKNRLYYEFAASSIKKKRRNLESLIEDKKQSLVEKQDFTLNNITSLHNLIEDKNNVLYLDLMIELYNMVNGIIKYNYLKKIEEIDIESFDPFISIVSCSKYDDVNYLYDENFLESLKVSMDKLLHNSNSSPDKYIDYLKDLGVSVLRHGEPLQEIDSTLNISKSKILGDLYGK